jgi:hypothetical protein
MMGRVLALALLLHASPALPAWLALDSSAPGTRVVRLCTGKGLRLVEVPLDDSLASANAGEDVGSGAGCVLCTLSKCTGCGSMPGPTACGGFETTKAGTHGRATANDNRPHTRSLRLRPPTRAPPVCA